MKFIWSKSNKSHIKWLYLLTRYVGLAAFAGNRFIGVGGSHPALSCKSFLSYQVTMTQVLVTLVQTILMLRVYALYNPGATSTIPNAQFNAVCGIVHIGSVMTSFRFAFVAIESILLLLTVIKCIYTFRVTRQPVPLITLLLRDGMLAFIAIVSILIPTSVTLVVDHGKN
ncbi:hypothetical protein BV22DRAFT_673653 [Leucogyrophana mollusca]|uniref:Uncharacterized protein n=1 Tax=Leucogyrophana mollusca TaxID=85980 RepID=A0ACB8BAG8_9AGAM|nr:hypothetical protein BV22DRAFT_673653 [Leucogyrophana mollusca]